MTAERWKRIQELFLVATEGGPDVAAQLLDKTTDDPELQLEVQKLVAASLQSRTGIGEIIRDAAWSAKGDSSQVSWTGERVGPYRLIRPLGSGGMATVYLAVRDDDQFQKQVAIKLIESGYLSPATLQRFRAERQILAQLEHPYIARLLDGGATSSGRPYVVMELVDGMPVDAYVAAHRLPVADRVRLMLRICEAVSYANSNLIVHRDLKPANILVTSDGTPKLLDFGIAKILDESARNTALNQPTEIFLTPGYASPEQLSGCAVTTATDSYALGIILYELLTGQKPFALSGARPSEIERRICEDLPPRPNVAAKRTGAMHDRALRGDLDNIVMKAIRKEPSRRYESAQTLGADLNRYLNGYPVEASANSFGYVQWKFVRRHGFSVAALGLLTTVLIIGLIFTRRAQMQAQQSFEQALSMANSSLFEVNDSLAKLPGSLSTRALLVRRTIAQVDALAARVRNAPAIRELAAGYEKLADIQYREDLGRLGDSAEALSDTRRALSLRLALAQKGDADARLAIADDYARLADIQQLSRSLGESANNYVAALAAYRDLQRQGASPPLAKIATAELGLGETKRIGGNLAEAAKHLESARNIYQDLLALNPRDNVVRRGAVDVALAQSEMEHQLGHSAQAIEDLDRALPIARGIVTDDPKDEHSRAQLASVLNSLGNHLQETNNLPQALDAHRESEAIIDRLADETPEDARLKRSVAIHNTNVALVLERMGARAEAETRYRRSLALHAALLQKDPTSFLLQDDVAYVSAVLGGVLLTGGHLSEAGQMLSEARESRERLIAANPENVLYRVRLARIYELSGDLAERRKHWADAFADYQKAHTLLSSLNGIDVTAMQRRVDARLHVWNQHPGNHHTSP